GLAKALGLALGVEHRHALDFDLEHQFNSGLDLGLGGVLQHLESDSDRLLTDHRVLFGHDLCNQHVHETAFVELTLCRGGVHAAHASISLSLSTAPLVTSTFL